MGATLDITDAGLATLEIPDPSGQLHTYRIARVAPAIDLWAVMLTRVDTEAAHRVALVSEDPPRYSCSCNAQRFRRRLGLRECKHIPAVRGLRAALKLLSD